MLHIVQHVDIVMEAMLVHVEQQMAQEHIVHTAIVIQEQVVQVVVHVVAGQLSQHMAIAGQEQQAVQVPQDVQPVEQQVADGVTTIQEDLVQQQVVVRIVEQQAQQQDIVGQEQQAVQHQEHVQFVVRQKEIMAITGQADLVQLRLHVHDVEQQVVLVDIHMVHIHQMVIATT